jgi:hypothetical protein
MIKKLLIAFSILLLTGCGADFIERKDTGNVEIEGGMIAVIDGCSVYRFKDGGERVYFVRCSDRTVTTSWEHSCGKNCTKHEMIPTYMTKD